MATDVASSYELDMYIDGAFVEAETGARFGVENPADLDAAVDGVYESLFKNTGQACTAGSRLLIHEAVHEEFVDRFLREVEATTVRYEGELSPDLPGGGGTSSLPSSSTT